jgi:hypothetical protein
MVAAGQNAAELNIGVRPRHGATFIVSSGLGSENRLVGHESYIVQMEKIRRAALPSRRSATSTSPARSIIPEYGHSSPDSNASSFQWVWCSKQQSVCDPRAHNRSAGSMSIPISGRVSAPYVMRCNLHGNSNNANVEVKQGPLGHYYFIRAPS